LHLWQSYVEMYVHHACVQARHQCCTPQTCPSCETATDLILVRHFPTFFEAFLYTCNIIQIVVTHSVTRTKTYVTLHTSGLLQRDLHQCHLQHLQLHYDASNKYFVKAFQVFEDLKNTANVKYSTSIAMSCVVQNSYRYLPLSV